MVRKLKTAQAEADRVRKDAEKAMQKVRETENLVKLAEEEDRERMESVRKSIDIACESNGFFCGVILTPEDIPGIIRLMIQTGENVKIGYSLYYNE